MSGSVILSVSKVKLVQEALVLPPRVMQNAVRARADTAQNIRSLGSLGSFRRSFWHRGRNSDSQGRSNWTARQEDRLLATTVVDFRATVSCSH